MKFWLPCLLIAALVSACNKQSPERPADNSSTDRVPGFWIWHHPSDLNAGERSALAALGNPRLYRQIVEFGWKDGHWQPRPLSQLAPEIPQGTIPVVRLDPGADVVEKTDTVEMLSRWLRYYFPRGCPDSIQLDYDCPVRLLPQYGALIRRLRQELSLKEISVTALASWIDHPEFTDLAGAVDELVPMFYDMIPDTAAAISAGNAVPMASAEAAKWIRSWKKCHTRWRAGLPDFERLSLFNVDGSSSGHLRQWSPEALLDAPAAPTSTGRGGVFFQVEKDAGLRGTALSKGQLLLWRAPGDENLRPMLDACHDAGARGIVWFAISAPGLRAHHSPAHLARLMEGEVPRPALSAHIETDGRVVLRNDGPGDLNFDPARRPYRLSIISAHTGAFGISGPGSFYRLDDEGGEEHRVKSVLSFTELQGGTEISSESGLITDRKSRDLRWSLDDSPPSPFSPP